MSERRSKRLKAQSRIVNTGEVSDNDSDQWSASEDQPRKKISANPRKRKLDNGKSSKSMAEAFRKVRGKRGALKHLTEAPLDVLFEIFGKLNPIDLLYLARTTKALRNILMRTSARFIWKQALANIKGLPDCPTDLNEPQYTNLVFGKNCYFCQRTSVPVTTVWTARLKSCSRCLNEHFTEYLPDLSIPIQIIYLIPDVTITRSAGRGRVRSVSLRYSALGKLWEEEYGAEDVVGKKLWAITKRAEYTPLNQHARLCEVWQSDLEREREQEAERARTERKEIALEKLKELGWAEEIQKISIDYYLSRSFDQHLAVAQNQKKGLTDETWLSIRRPIISFLEETKSQRLEAERKAERKRIALDKLRAMGWGEEMDKLRSYELSDRLRVIENHEGVLTDEVWDNIKVPIVAFLESAKASRLANERREMLQRRRSIVTDIHKTFSSSSPVNAIIAPLEYVIEHEEFRRIIHDTPISEWLTPASFTDAATKLPQISLQWEKEMQQNLIAMLNRSPVFDKENHDESDLNLAASVFRCSSCGCGILHYPRILMHRCGFKNISFRPEASKIAIEVLKLCGYDPMTTKILDVPEGRIIVECKTCSSRHQGGAMMTFLAAIKHGVPEVPRYSYYSSTSATGSNCTKGGKMDLRLPDNETCCKARERMAEENARSRAKEDYFGLTCAHCKNPGNSVSLEDHVKLRHNKTEVASEDIIPLLDLDHIWDIYWLWLPPPPSS